MEKFSRECLALAPEVDISVMYEKASALIAETLSLDGSVIVDISSFGSFPASSSETAAESTRLASKSLSRAPHLPSSSELDLSRSVSESAAPSRQSSDPFQLNSAAHSPLPILASSSKGPRLHETHGLSKQMRADMMDFLSKNPEGTIFELDQPEFFAGLTPDLFEYNMGQLFGASRCHG